MARAETITLTWCGITDTVNGWANRLPHLNVRIIRRRRRDGWSDAKCLSTPKADYSDAGQRGGRNGAGRAVIYTVDGFSGTVPEHAKRLGLDRSALIRRRTRQGMRMEDAIRQGGPGKPKTRRLQRNQDVRFLRAHADKPQAWIARALGRPPTTISYWMRHMAPEGQISG